MKPAPFSYVRPAQPSDVVAELVAADAGQGGKVIAGGQSLVPVLAMRLGRPGVLVDVTGVENFKRVGITGDYLSIGAGVRQRAVERNHTGSVPLLGRAIPWIGHREIRSRGTVCGSIAHADPSAELPAVAACLDAEIVVMGREGVRTVSARDFFVGAMTTQLSSTDVLSSVRFPTARPGDGFGFGEVARRHGDFALAGVAIHVAVKNSDVREATVVSFGVSDRPQVRDMTGALREAVRGDGADPDIERNLDDPVWEMARDVVTAPDDVQATTEYRQRLIAVQAKRELVRAYRQARKSETT
ncbi:FAD binding domain-containing protein [Flaviflexus massiliensis]|uniref:FAD binding domain-containing protein n=1 Tax=Flaviflexus massiliensis TaxID=1522309 RepID=UPI0006D553DF|nr:FAD binding domain-containing protein [Flaviflexus massiliensis]